MPSTTSLLRSAASIRKKVQAYEDDIAAFNWNTSAKTEEDYLEYANHLRDRATSASDPSSALSYQQKLVTARRSYTSHEIQRQTIDVLEGNSNLTNKYNTMVELYKTAIANDDYDLGQSLRLQLDNLDRSIQSQQQASQRLGATLASTQAKSIEDAVDFIQKEAGTPDAPATYQTLDGNGQPMALPTLAALRKIYEDGGEEGINQVAQLIGAARADGGLVNYWDLAGTIMENMSGMYRQAAELVGTDSSQYRTYLQKAQDVLDGKNFQIAPGMGSLSYKDVQDAIEASRAGQQLFTPSQKNGQNTFTKTKVTDFVYGRDAEGNYKIIPVRAEFGDNFGEDSTSKITVTGRDGHSRQVTPKEARELLSKAGFNVTTEDGELRIGTTGDVGIPGVSPGTSFTAVIGADGNLRLKSVDDRIIDLNLTDYGTVTPKEVRAEDTVSIFGEQGLGEFGKGTKQGADTIKQLLGQNQVRNVATDDLRVGEGFSGGSVDTSDVLSRGRTITQFDAVNLPGAALSLDLADRSPYASADLQRRINQAAARLQPVAPTAPQQPALQQTAAPVQNNKIFNLNQTPVGSGAILRVGTATPQANLNVAAPTATPKVTVGGLPKTGSTLSSYSGDLKVGF